MQSFDPASGEPVARFPCRPAAELREVLLGVRRAQAEWAALDLRQRCATVGRAGRIFYRRRKELAWLVTRETGKPLAEALFADVLISLELAAFYAAKAPRFLRKQRVRHGNLSVKAKSGWLISEPAGVVAIIAPWNYPLAIPCGQIVPALVAGNAVVFKPSEIAPGCGQALADCFAEAGLREHLLEVWHGGAEAGEALIQARPDKVVFTGSSEAGKSVGEACGRNLIPSVLELGGKDAMIVLADADLDAASSAAVWGAFNNCGQACLSVERIYVEKAVAEDFSARCVNKTRALRLGPGSDPDTEVGPMARAELAERVEALVVAAEAEGARILAGGRRRRDLGPCYFEPTIVGNVNPTMRIMREPIFGPAVAIQSVGGAEEAVALANDCEYGLSASVWTGDRKRGMRIAKRLQAGSVMVNDLASYFGIAEAPHGGRGLSGWGRTHSRLGLMEMVQVKYVDVDWLPRRPKPWWFGYNQAVNRLAEQFIEFSHAPGWRSRWSRAAAVLGGFFRGHRI